MDLRHLYGFVAVGIGIALGGGIGYLTGVPALGVLGFLLGAVGFDIFLRLHSHHEDRWLVGEEGAEFYSIPVWLLCLVLPLVFGVLAWFGYV